MESTYDEVLNAALSLPEGQRVQLVDALITTFEPDDAAPLDDAWLAEIERRSNEFDAGAVQPVPWEEVKQRARLRLKSNG